MKLAAIAMCLMLLGPLFPGPFVQDQESAEQSLSGSLVTWSEDFDDGDLNDLYVSYDDTDGGNANDYGNLVEVSTDQYVSGSYSLHIKSLNLNGGSVARAFAHSGYVEDWETLLEYTVSTSFFFPGTDNHWLVVIKTMDVHLVLTGDILGAHSALTGETKDIAQLNVSTWYQIQSNVLKFSGIYEVVINGTSYGWYNATSDSTGPKIVSVGDLGDTLSANSRGEGYWDDLCLDYRELEFGPVAYAGPDRTTKVGDTLDFLGEGAGGFQNNTWERHPFGWDEWIDQWPPGTNLTEYEYNGKIYAGLVAVEYYDGRAVYAPGNALVPSWGSEGVLYQLLVNSVRWVTRWKSPSSTDVLFVWGHEELTTYASASWNGPSAVSSEGYHVEVEELIPSNLSGYDVVVMLSAGWSWGAKISQQGYNNGWCSVTSSGCPKGNAPKQAEINSILSFVSGGGGFIATAEESDGNEYLNGISMPMGVHFLDSPNVAGGFWGNKVVPWHPILSRWEGVRAPIISWLWDFGDGSSQFGGRNASHAYAAPGVYNVTLTIEDSLGLTVSDSCLVHVTLDNQPPVADAGPDQTVNEGDTVQFNGTGSYDPDGGAFGWKVLSNMSFPRMSLAAAAVGQKIYAMGGNLCDEGCGGPVQQVPEHVVSAVEVYDATQNLWYEGVSMPTNRSELAAATVSDKIYAIGGTKGVMVMPMGTLDLNEEYDPVTGEWKSRAGMPTPRAAFGIAVVDGKVFAIGGYHFMPMSFYRALNVTEVYDPITDTWTTRSPMPTSRSFLALAALDRKIYAIGGAEDPRLIEVYDVDTDTWTTATEMPPMPSNRSLRGVSAVALAGRAYVMGGYSYDCVSSGVISYDPKTDQWRSEPTMNHPRAYLASVTIGNAIYAMGGTHGFMCGNPKPAEKFEAAGELTYEWDFDAGVDSDGDGNYTNDVDGTGPTPTHAYGDDGIYTVTLTVKDEYGSTDFDTMNVTVNNLPPGTTDPVIYGYGEEGSPVWGLTGDAIDPGSDDLMFEWDYGDGISETKTYYNNGLSPEPVYDPSTNEIKSPWGAFPFSISDQSDHIYGDNGVYPVSLIISDDDGGVVVFSTANSTIENVPPILSANVPSIVNEGDDVLFLANAVDNGTDDLTFIWEWGDGTPASIKTYYNNAPINTPDPYPSPWGTYPFLASDSVNHIYGDDGSYVLTLTVEDDDGGSTSYQKTITVRNVNPSVSIHGPYSGDENTEIYLTADATDPGSDDLVFTWEFEYGPTVVSIHFNDGMNPDPPQSPWGIFPFSASDSVSHVYGDNGNFTVTLTVMDDDGGVTVQQTVVIVNNVAPSIESTQYYFNASFSFRIAGEKWHNVEIHLYEDDLEIGYANITRYPGSPNDQMVELADLSIDFMRTYSAIAYYTPEDDPINGQIWGATPAWIIIDYEDGSEWIHHTFNVRHNETWIWEIDDFSPYFLGHNVTFTATASDPGSDDLIFTWDWGDGELTEHVYYNDGVSPDPYPSPDVNPITVMDKAVHSYFLAGTYTITLTITDDDGGTAVITKTLDL